VRVLLLALLLVAPATADASLIYVDDGRSVSAQFRSGCLPECATIDNERREADAPAWSIDTEIFGIALQQTSELAPSQATFSGSAEALETHCDLCDYYASGSSGFVVSFMVSEPVGYVLSGNVAPLGAILRSGPERDLIYRNTSPSFAYEGEFLPDVIYRLASGVAVDTRESWQHYDSFNLSLTLAHVPEPSTAALVFVGLLALRNRRLRGIARRTA
jgi:hypothetical protein